MTNAGPDADVVELNLFWSFDRLPASLRALIANAPYDYAVTPLLKELNAQVRVCGRHLAVDTAAREWPQLWAEDLSNTVLEIYGPDHPQAPAPARRKASRR